MDRLFQARFGRLTAVAILVTTAATPALAEPKPVAAITPVPTLTAAEFTARARRAGLRVLEGRHLVLATDRAPRDGDGLEELPRIFDAAFETWCRHYGLAADDQADWRALGCLVVERSRFESAGLLLDIVPDFTNGFCVNDRFWMMDQSNPAYRRHLLLHEGVHAFTLTLRSLATPTWYTEGIAECLATHRLEDGRFVNTPIPRSAEDVEQLGRIEQLQQLVRSGKAPSLHDVFAAKPSVHRSIASYAASWAAVAMLAGHPRYAAGFTAIERGPLDAAFTERLSRIEGWGAATVDRDFAAFFDDLDYGYDFSRSAIDWTPAPRLASKTLLTVAAGRGWQHAGTSLEAGRRYSLTATGRAQLGRTDSRVIESGAEGISLDWYRGRPLGRLLVAQWVEEPGRQQGFRVLAEGGKAEFAAATDGPVYLRINEAPVAFSDSGGTLHVSVSPLPRGE